MKLRPLSRTARLGFALALAGAGGVLIAQQGGGSGTAGSFEVDGIVVDVRGKDAESARLGGWRLAQRKAWAALSQRLTGKAGSLSDSALDGIVSGIVVESEQIGPNRYIARLGVLFDRGRAGGILGVSGTIRRSAPMLLVPIQWSGGAGHGFERETEWQRAWARFRIGNSSIDYVRPGGTGPDAMLLNAGQIGRNGRNWWRTILDQYGASDVLVAEVALRRDYPGGPVVAAFQASHGPDKRLVTKFALRVENSEALPALLDAGVERIDKAYQDALASGMLRTDALLAFRPPTPQAVEEESDEDETALDNSTATPTPTPSAAESTATTLSVQVDTPSGAAVTSSESAIRGIPGVRSAATSSMAIGGISVLRVTYDGSQASLRAALEARGWQVQEGPGVLRIRRPGGSGNTPSPASTSDSGEE